MSSQVSGKYSEFLKLLILKMSPKDIDMVMRAYNLSKEAHRGQQRDDKTRYFDHLRETALILMDLGVYDRDLIISCLLHDSIEDNPGFMSRGAIACMFNDRIADIVTAVTKPKKGDKGYGFESDAERHRFYFGRLRESNNDVLLVKLADRLHNMRTLHTCTPEKVVRKAKETTDIYLPLCEKLSLRYPTIGEYFHKELTELVEKNLKKKK